MKERKIIIGQGDSKMMRTPSHFPPNNPLTATGKKVMTSMTKQYGTKKGKQVFYATMNKYNKKWHK